MEEDNKVAEMPACISEEYPAPASKKRRRKKKKTIFKISASSLLDESALDGRHLVVKCSLGNENPIETPALTDCGASGFAFVDEQFVCCKPGMFHQEHTQIRLKV